jgi:RHS repeat-associated protein
VVYFCSGAHTYDWAGNLLTSTDAADATTTYTYSPANEIQSITSSANDTYHPPHLVSNVVNGPDGPVSYSLGNGLSMLRNYDALGRLQGSWVCNGPPTGGCPHAYGFSINSRKGNQVLNACDDIIGQCTTYGYDDFNRLKSSSSPAPLGFSYAYDRYGNRWSQTATAGSGPQPQFTFNAANNQISGFTYDAAGNMTGDGTHTYTYDAEGNLTAVDAGATAKYTYNAFNQRVRIDTGGTSAEFRFNPSGQRASNWDGNSLVPTRGQYYWGATPIAYYTGQTHFQHLDWLGTARLQTSYNGAVEGSYYSLPWGDGFNDTDGAAQFYSSNGAPADDAYHLAALDHDTESDTDHAQFRNYSPIQGRWLSPDPYNGSYDASNPQSFNRYAYVLNNPLSYTDPQGTNYTDSNGNYCLTWNSTNSAGTIVSNVLCTSSNPSPSSSTNLPWFISEYGGAYGQPGGQCLLSDGAVVTCPQQPTTKSPAPTKPAPNNATCQLSAPGGNYNLGPNAVALFQPQMSAALTNAFNFLNSQGITPTINSGFRSPADQIRMQNGGSGPNPAATVSWHQAGMAVDINGTSSSFFPTIISAMQAQGLTWGGTFTHRDPPHFQLPRPGTSPSAATVKACAAAAGGHG